MSNPVNVGAPPVGKMFQSKSKFAQPTADELEGLAPGQYVVIETNTAIQSVNGDPNGNVIVLVMGGLGSMFGLIKSKLAPSPTVYLGEKPPTLRFIVGVDQLAPEVQDTAKQFAAILASGEGQLDLTGLGIANQDGEVS